MTHGLLIPFRRDRKRDWASGQGPELTKAKVIQILMTDGPSPHTVGELPWRTNFGASLSLLRHQSNPVLIKEMARVYIRDALTLWAPTLSLQSLKVFQEGTTVHLRIEVAEKASLHRDSSPKSAEVTVSFPLESQF